MPNPSIAAAFHPIADSAPPRFWHWHTAVEIGFIILIFTLAIGA